MSLLTSPEWEQMRAEMDNLKRLRELAEADRKRRQAPPPSRRECPTQRSDAKHFHSFFGWKSGTPFLQPDVAEPVTNKAGTLFHLGYDGALQSGRPETLGQYLPWGSKSTQDTGHFAVHGSEPVTNTGHTYPHRCVGLVQSRFEASKSGRWVTGSAFMVSPSHVLCSAHSVFNPDLWRSGPRKGYCSEFVFYPAIHGDDEPYPCLKARAAWIAPEYIAKYGTAEADAHDFALVLLDWRDGEKRSCIGQEVGWFGLAGLDERTMQTVKCYTSGYPASTHARQTVSDAPVTSSSAGALILDVSCHEEGLSGSPVYYSDKKGNRLVVGIATGGTKGGMLHAVRLTPERIQQISDWMRGRMV